jgi:hypothetical protein
VASELAHKWRGRGHEKISEHLEEHIEECLTCLAFPESHQRRIRTTNGLERLNQEIKRRTRVVRIFPNRDACLRLVTALCVEHLGRGHEIHPAISHQTETPCLRDSFTGSLHPVEHLENRYETGRNALRSPCADEAGAGTLRQLYLTECLIGTVAPIKQLHDLYGEKVRVTVTGSLTRNRQAIYWL